MPPSRILICRSDALGDALLALPVCTALKRAFPQASVAFLASAYAADVLELHAPAPDQIIRYDPNQSAAGLARELRRQAFDAALLIFPDPRVSWAVWRAGIPLRVGTGRRWWSLLYNRRVPHQRSRAERHEADYNLDLVRALGVEAALAPPRLQPGPEESRWATAYLARKGLGRAPWIVVHPGSRGSADNWPPEKYGQLSQLALTAGVQVFLSGAPREFPLLQAVAAASGRPLPRMEEPVTLRQLAAIIRQARAFVSCSTGPMHLAAGLGVPTVALFPAAGVTGPVRWRPLTPTGRVLTPNGGAGVETIAPEAVARALRDVLGL